MKKTFLFLMAMLGALTINAKTIYLNTGGSSLWGQADAVFFVHSWSTPEDNADAKMTLVSGDVFSATIAENHNNVVFVRMPNGATSLDWDAKWNQTADLAIPSDKDMYTITGWNASDGAWSTYSAGGGQGQGGQGGGGGQTGDGNPRYYYKGWIDGADVEPSDATLFNGGIALIDCMSDSYVFVLYQVDGEQGVQYMTNTPNNEPSPASPAVLKAWDQGNKMFVPAGTEYLYLYDNGDQTLTLSITQLPGKTLVGGGSAQAFDQVIDKKTVNKSIVNGQLVITIDGVRYNANGVRL